MNMHATLEEVPQAARDTLREASEIKYARPHCLGGSTLSKAPFKSVKILGMGLITGKPHSKFFA